MKERYDQTFEEDREAHVYRVNGIKQYFRVRKELSDFEPHKNVEYLGIAQEPIEGIGSSTWYLERQAKKKATVKQGVSKYHKDYVPPTKKPILNRLFDGEAICCYCEISLTPINRTREHVIPKRVGGKIIMPCCRKCNEEKGGLMLHSYIQLLNLQLSDAKGDKETLIQIKIKNANRIAIEIENKHESKA